MRRALALLLAALALSAAAARPAAAQNTCELVYQNGPWSSVGDPANRVIAADGPLLVRCSGGEELRADSAVIYQNINEVHLFGQVDYQDPTRALTSDRATYNSQTGRLYATGNVVFTDKNRGSTLRGPELEYFKAMPGRPDPQAIAVGRPHLTITPKQQSGGRRREPMEVDADRVTSIGDRFMTAEGNVVIVSRDTRSTAEEAHYDATEERVELRRRAVVDGEKYDLRGDFIESRLKEGELQQVLARGNAQMESERLTATGPQLQLFFERELLQRMVSSRQPGSPAPDSAARSEAGARSVALAKGFRMEADSIEAVSPDQRLKQVNAVGRAQGVSWDTIPQPSLVRPDSGAAVVPVANRPMTEPPPGIDQRDVLTADTIIAFFRPKRGAAAADTARRGLVRPDTAPRGLVRPGPGRPAPASADTAQGDTADTEIERLLAIGDARSLYRLKNDSAGARRGRPALNYLIGDRIDLTFEDGEVDVAHVRGLKKGVYLDPEQAGSQVASDSAAAQGGRRTPPRAAPGAARPAGAGQPPRPAPAASPPPAPPAPSAQPRRTPAGGTRP
ncbi:MAG TPA: OstA-like protein [Longimicrobium sp.]|jgi:lipopolysaccharide export system protein LptA